MSFTFSDPSENEYPSRAPATCTEQPAPPGQEQKPPPGSYEEESIYMDLPPKTTKHLFDELPLEVIREVIFPYLDFESKICVNRCLPIQDRLTKKIPRKSIESHDIFVSTNNFQSRLNLIRLTRAVDRKTKNKKTNMIIRMMKEFHTNRHGIILRNHPNFRMVLIKKLKEFINPDGEIASLTRYFRKKLIHACKIALVTLESMTSV
jgi:hypothetical protein